MKYKIFLAVFIIGIISAVIITTNSHTGLCAPGEGCSIVNSSQYGSTFGVENSIYGIFIFSFMVLLTLLHIRYPSKHTKRVIHTAIIIGSLISVYFLYLQFFVIKAFCEFCLAIDISMLISLGFLIYLWEH